ncbi:LysR family transcriptional regulator [Microbacterium sp. 22303]|uniref:LysR family transcriptional regulator n=1 Tax=Microbacterium sp. 22303 TaxID=3453905 RepID=UPI003F85E922
MLDLAKLAHLRALARHGSFVGAASSLYISQPALTRSIQSLEKSLSVTLVVRHRTGVTLTPEGQEFLTRAEALLSHAESLEDDVVSSTRGGLRRVAFGIGPMTGAMLLDDVLAMMIQESRVAAAVRIGSNTDLRRMLLHGEIEFFVGGMPSHDFTQSHHLDFVELATSQPALYTRADHPLVYDPDARLSDFPLIGGSFARLMLDESDLVGLPAPLLELDDYDLLLRLASTTDALLLAAPGLAARRPNFQLSRVDHPVGRSLTVGVVSVSGRPLSSPARSLVDIFTGRDLADAFGEILRYDSST